VPCHIVFAVYRINIEVPGSQYSRGRHRNKRHGSVGNQTTLFPFSINQSINHHHHILFAKKGGGLPEKPKLIIRWSMVSLSYLFLLLPFFSGNHHSGRSKSRGMNFHAHAVAGELCFHLICPGVLLSVPDQHRWASRASRYGQGE